MGSSLRHWTRQKLAENDTGLVNGEIAGSYLKNVYLEDEVPKHSHNAVMFYRDKLLSHPTDGMA